jgi:hypothetical protein
MDATKVDGKRWLRRGLVAVVIATIAIAVVVVGPGVSLDFITSTVSAFTADEFEYGKSYGLVSVKKVQFSGGNEGMAFEFADRNLPRTSIVVPFRLPNDPIEFPMVVEDKTLPPGTAVPKAIRRGVQKFDGISYTGFVFPQWRYNPDIPEMPTIAPRQ